MHPMMRRSGNDLVIELANFPRTSRTCEIRMVVDFDSEQSVLGIEIVNLFLQLGESSIEALRESLPTMNTLPTFRYDEDADCFYMRFSNGLSSNQKALSTVVYLDDLKRIVGFQIRNVYE